MDTGVMFPSRIFCSHCEQPLQVGWCRSDLVLCHSVKLTFTCERCGKEGRPPLILEPQGEWVTQRRMKIFDQLLSIVARHCYADDLVAALKPEYTEYQKAFLQGVHSALSIMARMRKNSPEQP
ncbi:hypothetical protein [Acetonema longum]|uniref:Uncharacterized protein n=1 Tax=Acetonema longum DSM 6540 TaxID=1009370 RepID=F7NEJ4_9FIRM|nr:hypothetical protein [Acetonema longum]EGO65405.1 hypothetical protein ALO_02286 [Acetonema longum DSM 6540]